MKRRLQVEAIIAPHTFNPHRRQSTRSLIRLKGVWLRKAGFEPYTRVNVQVSPEHITITPYDHDNHGHR